MHHTHQTNPPMQHYHYQQQQHQLPTTTPNNAYYGYPLREQLSPDTTMYQMTEYSNAAASKMDSSWSPGSVSHAHNHIHHHMNHQFHQSQGQGHYVQSANVATNAFQPATATDALYDHHVASGLQSKLVYSATQQSAPSVNSLKSKSVPDILKQLNDELQTSEGRRVRNNSQSNAGPAIDGNANKKRKF